MMRTPLPVLEAMLDTLLVRSSKKLREKNSFTTYYIILNITITHREAHVIICLCCLIRNQTNTKTDNHPLRPFIHAMLDTLELKFS